MSLNMESKDRASIAKEILLSIIDKHGIRSVSQVNDIERSKIVAEMYNIIFENINIDEKST